MILGKVIGNVVSTQKHPDYVGEKILIVQPIDAAGKAAGKSLLAIDRAQAGVGDRVLINDEGNSARMIIGNSHAPIRTVIIGIVDAVEMSV
jgi:ethanolamine utilization protein EutN